MDILREGLALVAPIIDLSHKGNWPAALRDVGTSGALEKIVESLESWLRVYYSDEGGLGDAESRS